MVPPLTKLAAVVLACAGVRGYHRLRGLLEVGVLQLLNACARCVELSLLLRLIRPFAEEAEAVVQVRVGVRGDPGLGGPLEVVLELVPCAR